jgi:hypothetical protein
MKKVLIFLIVILSTVYFYNAVLGLLVKIPFIGPFFKKRDMSQHGACYTDLNINKPK